MNDQLQSGIRFILKFLGGILVKQGYTDDSGWTEFAGGLMAVIGFIWGMCHRSNGKVTTATPMFFLLGCCMAAQIFVYECRRFFAAVLLLACLALVLLAPGCANKAVVTTGADGVSVTNFVKGPDVARIANLAGGAAQIGTQLRLVAHPEDRAIFETTRQALQGLADAKNYDPAAFTAALSSLPVKTLQGEQGAIYISGAVLIWDEAIAEAEPLTRQELVAATLSKVAEGIGKGLAATAPRSERWERLQRVVETGAWGLEAISLN